MSWIVKAVSAHRKSPQGRSLIRWGVGGWTFFIAENALLSENRNTLIGMLGDDNYHMMYGTISTIATVSIGYAYYKLSTTATTHNIPSNLILWKHRPTLVAGFTGWILISTGMIIAAQAAPKMQIPIAFNNNNNSNSSQSSSSSSSSISVRCPFDFSDKHSSGGGGGTVGWDGNVHGLDRISRHPGLWSFGIVGLGQAVLSPNIPKRIWWM
jgi:uncharacterized membrane protein YgcG